jgi:hypothetical protein
MQHLGDPFLEQFFQPVKLLIGLAPEFDHLTLGFLEAGLAVFLARFSIFSPSSTSDWNSFSPSSWVLAKAPSPASQMRLADSRMLATAGASAIFFSATFAMILSSTQGLDQNAGFIDYRRVLTFVGKYFSNEN